MALNKKNNASEYGTYMNMSDGVEQVSSNWSVGGAILCAAVLLQPRTS
jgi:hypothetical protein